MLNETTHRQQLLIRREYLLIDVFEQFKTINAVDQGFVQYDRESGEDLNVLQEIYFPNFGNNS